MCDKFNQTSTNNNVCIDAIDHILGETKGFEINIEHECILFKDEL